MARKRPHEYVGLEWMAQKRLSEEEGVFPLWFSIPGLGALVVHFLPLGQWSEWLWQWSKTQHQELSKMLIWRAEMDAYGYNRCLLNNDYNLLKHMSRLQSSDVMRMRPQSDLIWDLTIRQEEIVRFLLQRVTLGIIHEAFYVCCSSMIPSDSIVGWRLPLLLSCITNEIVALGFIKACTLNNIAIARYLWNTGRVQDHRVVFEQLSLTVSKTMFEFLLGLGYDYADLAHMRARFLTEVVVLQMIDDTDLFPLLERVGIIRPQDLQHFFEVAFSCNNVRCLKYFYARYSTFQLPVTFNLEDGIRSSECLDILMMHKKINIDDVSFIIRKIRCDIFDRAKDVVLHTLQTHVKRKTACCFWNTVTFASWRARNVPLLSWLWDKYNSQTKREFARCFATKTYYCSNPCMLQFLLEHCDCKEITTDAKREHIIRAIRRRNIDMFKLLLRHELVSEHDFFNNNILKASLQEFLLDTVDFLKLMWKPTAVWAHEHDALLKHAIRHECGESVFFLLEKNNHIPKSILIENVGFFVHHGMHQTLDMLSSTDITADVRDEFERWSYASISRNNTIATIETLWRILPISHEQLAAENCELFWRICQTNVQAGVFLWHKQLLTAVEILQDPPFPNTTHDFLAAIHYDV